MANNGRRALILRPRSGFEKARVVAEEDRVFPILFAAFRHGRPCLPPEAAPDFEKLGVGLAVRAEFPAKAGQQGGGVESVNLGIAQILVLACQQAFGAGETPGTG